MGFFFKKLSMLTICTLFAVLRFLSCRAAAVGSCDVLFLLGLGLHLPFVRVAPLATPAEGNAILQYLLKIVHTISINDGTGAHP